MGGTKIPNKKKFRGKGVHVPSENCDNFFILRDKTMVGQGQMKDDIRMMASFIDIRIFT